MGLRGYRFSTKATGSYSGERINSRVGAGAEFAEYRSYESGDDPRFVDWNVYARSGKLFVRKFRLETSTRVYAVGDVSASMQNKIEAYQNLLGFLRKFVRNDSWRQLEINTLAELAHLTPEQPGLVLLVSDALEPIANWREAISKLAMRGFDVALLQLLAADDVNPPEGAWRLQDVETKKTLEADDVVRKIYLENLRVHNLQVANMLHGYGFKRTQLDSSSDQAKWFTELIRAHILERGQ